MVGVMQGIYIYLSLQDVGAILIIRKGDGEENYSRRHWRGAPWSSGGDA